MNKQRKKRENQMSRHHIIPSSRGGRSNSENLTNLTYREHTAYHSVFENLTPTEIVGELVNKYWNGNWSHVKDAYEHR